MDVTGSWRQSADRSPLSGRLARDGARPALGVDLQPTVARQELDTRATTGVIYWEGSQRVAATRDGSPVAGQGYVELTGYGPSS